MSDADFLLSPAVQAVLKLVLSEPARAFAPAELMTLARLEPAAVEGVLPHLLGSGVLVRSASGEGGQDDTAQADRVQADTSFVFYPELRRIACKSFAGAEPLRAMLRSKFRRTVSRAFLLGEDRATGTLELLIVHDGEPPGQDALDAALRRLLKTGALRQHVAAHVLSSRQFAAVKPGDALHAQLASETCVELIAGRVNKAATRPASQAGSLLERARKRWSRLAG